jgi:hypothetical protein
MSEDRKEEMWQAYWEGFKVGRGVESYQSIAKRTARDRFERWWTKNKE